MRRISDVDRRRFLQGIGGAAAGLAAFSPKRVFALTSESDPGDPETHGGSRRRRCLELRRAAALEEFRLPVPEHRNNGDEDLYPNIIGNYSKGLPHSRLGEVAPRAYQSFLHALHTGSPGDFEDIVIGGNVPLVDPQAGLAFDMEGTDSHQLALGPPPALASAERASEAVECYWMALLRDVNFTQYASNPIAREAAEELSQMSDFRGPKENGRVTRQTLFRGFTTGDLIGPYVSQFLPQNRGFRCGHRRTEVQHLCAREGLYDRPRLVAGRAGWKRPFRSQSD